MRNSGISMIGMLFSLLVIAFLTLIVLKPMGINNSKTVYDRGILWIIALFPKAGAYYP